MVNNQGIIHAAYSDGGQPICKNRNAHMSSEIAKFRTYGASQCKRCAAKLVKMDAVKAKKEMKALEIGRANLAAHSKAQIDFTFNVWAKMTDLEARERMQQELDAKYGYRHGWYKVGEFCFDREDLTGEKYDATQGGWAFL